MIILGIDPGYAIVGYGVIEKNDRTGKCSVIDYGAIETDKDEAFPTRLAIIQDGMKELIEKFKPDAVAVEELFFNTNITTGIAVAEARGESLCARLFKSAADFLSTLQFKSSKPSQERAEPTKSKCST